MTATGFTSPTRYVNGVAATAMVADVWQMVAVTTATAITTTNIQLATDNTNFGDCSLSNLLIFDRVLTATEILNLYKGTTFKYWQDVKNVWDMSNINTQDIGWVNNGKNGTNTGLAASTDIILEDFDFETQFNGTDEKIEYGDIGNTMSFEMWIKPYSTTEEIVLLDSGKSIKLDSGTVTYTGITETNTFVNGVDTNTMVAGRWQHLVCVFTQVDANTFTVATDGTNYGAIDIGLMKTYSTALEQNIAEDRYIQGGKQ